MGLNPHGEITSLLFPGRVVMQKQTLLSCIHKAFTKAKSVAEAVQQAVEDDLAQRKATFVKPSGYSTKTLRSDSAYNRWLFNQRVSQKRLKVEDEVSIEEDMPDTLDANLKQSRSMEDNDLEPQVTPAWQPSGSSPHKDMDGDMANGTDEEDEDGKDGDEEEEEEEMQSKLTAKDLM